MQVSLGRAICVVLLTRCLRWDRGVLHSVASELVVRIYTKSIAPGGRCWNGVRSSKSSKGSQPHRIGVTKAICEE